jgi:hypothetical protein
MRYQRSDFPVHEQDYALGASEQPVLLDGMEVVFDKTVGLTPVALVADQPTPAPAAGETDAYGTRRRT